MKTPVALVTGYLGSGKTTLIRALLEDPGLGETAVIVNELGEIGIDHAILRRVDERTVLLASGCVCCTLRGDLADELRDLLDRRATGEIPPFTRVVVETTGVADPAPIVATLVSEPLVRHQYALESVIATVDAQHGLRGEESERQVAAADVLVVTKGDLADPAERRGHARRRSTRSPPSCAPSRATSTRSSCSAGGGKDFVVIHHKRCLRRAGPQSTQVLIHHKRRPAPTHAVTTMSPP